MTQTAFALPGLGPTPLDDARSIWVSGFIEDWEELRRLDISVIVDLEGDIDHGVPRTPDNVLYVYLPIHDAHLPNLDRLHSVASLVAELAARGQRVLCHCGVGLNRSPLVAGLAMVDLGCSPEEVVAAIRARRPGSLYNPVFVAHLLASEQVQGVGRLSAVDARSLRSRQGSALHDLPDGTGSRAVPSASGDPISGRAEEVRGSDQQLLRGE